MIYHHRTMPNSKISEVTNKVEDVKLVMHENIERCGRRAMRVCSIGVYGFRGYTSETI